MGEITTTTRGLTNNQGTFDSIYTKLLISANSYLQGETFENIEGAITTFPMGTILGRIGASQNLTICKSGAVDGSQIPVAILTHTLTDVAIAGTAPISPVNGGEVNANVFVFDGTDTLATLVSGTSIKDHLIRNGKDLEISSITDDSKYDN